jgi:hypothetical protein
MRVVVRMGMFVRMLMQVSMREFTRKFMRKFVRKFVREEMGRKIGIEKPIVLMTLLMGLFINALFVMQLNAGVLSGHFTSPSFDSVLNIKLDNSFINRYLSLRNNLLCSPSHIFSKK